MSLQETWNCKNDCKACSWHLIFFRLVSKYCCLKKKYNPIPSHCFTIPIRCNPISCFVPATNNALIAQCDPSLHTHSDLFLPSLFVPTVAELNAAAGACSSHFFPAPPRPAASWYFHFLPQKIVAFKNCYKYVCSESARDNDRAGEQWMFAQRN